MRGPAGDPGACARHLPGLAEGSVVGALAWAETPGWEASDLSARAEPAGAAWLLGGTKRYVPAGPAEPGLVPAFARAADTGRLGLFELTAAPAGFTVRSTLDRTRPLAELTLDRTPARLLAPDGDAVLARVRGLACTALAAEQAGAAARALEVTVRYAKDRVQLGRPIGAFQAVKHRLADMHTAVTSPSSAPTAPPTCSARRPRTGHGWRPASVSPRRTDEPTYCRTLAP
ncbi:acyl-CoA dehydrogenase family protein [Streptomyces kutzneri]|uniref:acyl-CoA dehydrogenase family protein n=1 Tax=Streptomyces kutzneri TaxID=3051179 RepID=UPI0028D4B898|nr:acyl-CoA dehydrogenase family protein [Streptomyces sp. DSM 40907]